MQDPPLTIRSVLYDNWALTGNNLKSKLNFETVIPDPRARKYPSIEVTKLTEDRSDRGLGGGHTLSDQELQVDIWVKIPQAGRTATKAAEARIYALKEEVDRIRKAFRKNFLQDGETEATRKIRYAFPIFWVRRDEPDSQPPLLRRVGTLRIWFFNY